MDLWTKRSLWAQQSFYSQGYGLQLEGENYLSNRRRITHDTDIAASRAVVGFLKPLAALNLKATIASWTRTWNPFTLSGSDRRGLALYDPPANVLLATTLRRHIAQPARPYGSCSASEMIRAGMPLTRFSRRRGARFRNTRARRAWNSTVNSPLFFQRTRRRRRERTIALRSKPIAQLGRPTAIRPR